MKLLIRHLCLLLTIGIAHAAEQAWEANFSGNQLDSSWKVSGNKEFVSVGDGKARLKATSAGGHSLTQIVQTGPQFFFLEEGAKPLHLTTELAVAPAEKGAVGRIMISSKPGQARNEDAFAVLVNGAGEYRILRIVDGVTANQRAAWKPVPGGVAKVEIVLDATHYTVRLWSSEGVEPVEETGSHEITQSAWGEAAHSSLALGAWNPAQANGGEADVTFNSAKLQRE